MLTLETKELWQSPKLDYTQGRVERKYLAEFVQRADTPAAVRLDSHNLMESHDMGRATSTKSGGWMLDPSMLSAKGHHEQAGSVAYAFLIMPARSLSLNFPSGPRFKLEDT